MSMDIFRRKQKWIFWIVTIIVVPSFVLVWGVSGRSDSRQNYVIATVNGEKWSAYDYQQFQKRINAATGEYRFVVVGAPDDEVTGSLWSHMWAYSLLLDAEKIGLAPAEKQVGTYIQRQHPVLRNAPPGTIDAEVDNYCRRLQISRAEFLLGVRELLTVANYIGSDSATVAVSDDSAYGLYAQRRSQVRFKRFRTLETAAMADQAKKDILDLPPSELESRIRDHAARLAATDSRYREPARWKFAFALIPNVADVAPRNFSEDELRNFYQENRETLYQGQAFDQARTRIFADMAVREGERMTLRNLAVDVDPQLRDYPDLTLEELGKLTPLVKNSVRTGVTADELLTADELVAGSLFDGETSFKTLLDMLDGVDADSRDPQIEQWRSGFDLGIRPIKVPQGYLRLRLLAYQPSRAAEIDDSDGTIRAGIRDLAVTDLVGERVAELAMGTAGETMEKLRAYYDAVAAGEKPGDEFARFVEAVPEEAIAYSQVNATDDGEFVMLGVGDLQPPKPFTDIGSGAKGWEIRVVTGRHVPSRSAFDAEAPETRNGIRMELAQNIRGQIGLGFSTSGLMYQVRPTNAMWATFLERMRKDELTPNPEVFARS